MRYLVSVMLMLMLTQSALAVAVSYSTTGVIGGGGVLGGGYTLSYTGQPLTLLNVLTFNTPQATDFGSFQLVSATNSSSIGPVSVPFTMSVTQFQPVPGGPAPLAATISGSLAIDPINGGSGGLSVLFTPSSTVQIDGVVYAINPNPFVINPPSFAGVPTNTDIRGTLTVVPVPPAVWGGLSLMGLMGVKGYRRQRLNKAAV